MKNTKALFGVLALTFAVLFSMKADIFLGSSTNVNSLVIASNEVILISATRIQFPFLTAPTFAGQISMTGTIQSLGMDSYCETPLALAGPATLSFPADSGTNSIPVCICFQRIRGSSIQSLYVPGIGTNPVPSIEIPAGKTCHLFPAVSRNSGGVGSINVNVQTTSNAVSGIRLRGREEFTGPVTLTFSDSGSWTSVAGAVVSFYQTDDALNLPNGVLQGPTGTFVITVEKSEDLTHWSPVMMQATGDSQKAFYRLNFSH